MRTVLVGFVMLCVAQSSTWAQRTFTGNLEPAYDSTIQPLLRRYCNECHSEDDAEADVDLSVFTTVASVRDDVKIWLKVRRMLDTNQMPPKDSPQPTDAERSLLHSWVGTFLTQEATARAGDPGPVILRRLNNAEYNYTIQDLTAVPTLDPTQEFPVDGAAGEGFTNTGSAQAMSPALVTKYLDAAKDVASHAILLPDGIRFSPHTTRRDHTDELMASIQAFYRQFTQDGGGTTVNLDGNAFKTNQGGLLPVESYIRASLEERDALASGLKTFELVAHERSLNGRYFRILMEILTSDPSNSPSFFIGGLRSKWQNAGPGDTKQLVDQIVQSQAALWKFNSVGQYSGEGTQKTWMEAVTPVVFEKELRLKLPATPDADAITIYLTSSHSGGEQFDAFVDWDRPRFEFPAEESGVVHPPILLRNVPTLVESVRKAALTEVPRTADYLRAVASLRAAKFSIAEAADENALNAKLLAKWAELVGFRQPESREIQGSFTDSLTAIHGNSAINGWGSSSTPSMLTNQSDDDVILGTLTLPGRSIVVHPSPTQESVIAWRSPIDGHVTVEGLVADADNNCGNGVTWRVELLQTAGRATPADGVFDGGGENRIELDAAIDVRQGDIVRLIVNARDNNHACDTTHVELTLSEVAGSKRIWNLASDVVDSILDANPLPDAYGHASTWHFAATDISPGAKSLNIPGSALAQWRAAVVNSAPTTEINHLALAVQTVATQQDVSSLNQPDQQLHQQLHDWQGPLRWMTVADNATTENTSLKTDFFPPQAPQMTELRLPATMAAGAEFVTTATLHEKSDPAACVQVHVSLAKPNDVHFSASAPVLVQEGSVGHDRIVSAMEEYRNLFPTALSYSRIVPVDEVVTMALYFREDEHLQRLMLDDQQVDELDRLWDELLYVSREPIALTVVFEQIYEFATQDRPDLVKSFAPMRGPINERADTFRQRLIDTEPSHIDAVLEFAHRAWRRPLTEVEQTAIRRLYDQLRNSELPHEESVRLTLAHLLASPSFLYRREQPGAGPDASDVTSIELANRLSYFLWSSLPDDELRAVAEGPGPFSLRLQAERMLQDPRTRRLAVQFACQWLHLRDFDKNDDKNEKLYPQFASLRTEMYEETVRFFEDIFRNDGSILSLLDADHTFLNESLAKHYGIDDVTGAGWQRVNNVRAKGRGGVLGMATLLASQSGASRTSPILRGNWIYETLLGERLPRPPSNVPQLPETLPSGLTARQLIERHTSISDCAKCHIRIDPYGFALEQYDAIGRLRPDVTDTMTELENGTKIDGIDGLREYLLTDRREDVVRHFCRKLLGFALGREVQLSDEVLLAEMQSKLEANEYRFNVAVEAIVLSEQFQQIRGREFAEE